MSRIDVLQQKYPTIPREVIVKYEALNTGVRYTADLDKLHGRRRKLPGYQSYDHNVTLKEMIDESEVGSLPPDRFFMANGQSSFLVMDSHSPYGIRELSPDRFFLCEGEEKVQEIFFVDHPPKHNPLTSKGTPTGDLIIPNSPVCFCVNPVRFCEYFTHGEECKFCDFNPSQEDARSIGIDRRVTIDLEDTAEAWRILSSEKRYVEGGLEMGAFRNDEQEVKIFASYVERLASGASYKPNLRANFQPMSRKNLQRLKDAGLDEGSHHMEVWDRQLFEEVCPGKAKSRGYDRFIEGMLESVDVFGVGNVKGNLVGGVTCLPPNGHKSWEDSRDSMIEGITWMIQHGVLGSFMPLRLRPASVYGKEPANLNKYPPTEYYLDLIVAHDQTMNEVGLYDKMCKFLVCAMDGIGVAYGGEAGILKRAGNLGNWLADTIPAECNWLARFIATASSATEGSTAAAKI